MKKIFVLIIAAQIACHSNADAQIWKKVADKVKQTVSDKTVDKAGNATSDAYDKATDIHVKKDRPTTLTISQKMKVMLPHLRAAAALLHLLNLMRITILYQAIPLFFNPI